MKVIILKSLDEMRLVQNVARISARERKQAVAVRICCVEEATKDKLQSAGIQSEIIDDFSTLYEEAAWERMYEISDRLYASAAASDRFKYAGINVLTLEHSNWPYVFAVKLSRLCQSMAQQGCDLLVLVVAGPLSIRLPNINTATIRTIRDRGPIDTLRRTLAVQVALAISRSLPQSREPGARHGQPDLCARRPHEMQSQPTALLVVRRALNARPAMAIVNECRKKGLRVSVVTDEHDLSAFFRRHSIGCLVMPRRRTSYPRALLLYSRLSELVKQQLEAEADQLSEAHLCTKILMDRLFGLCCYAVTAVDFLARMMEVASPDILVLCPDGYFFQHLAAAVAERSNIPTLACSAALENALPRALLKHLHADKKAVTGEVIRDLYVASGVHPGRIAVTGAANFDALFDRDKERDKHTLLAYGVDPTKRIILFATQHIAFSETRRMLIGVITAVRSMRDVQLIVKVHPSEDSTQYKALAREFDTVGLHVTKDMDLYALINTCDVLITKYSTTALEAMMLDKPVIVINLSGQPTPVPYAEEGAALGVYKHEDIQQAIIMAVDDEETQNKLKAGRRRFIKRWAGEPDGKAAQRIVTLVKEMIAASAQHSRGSE